MYGTPLGTMMYLKELERQEMLQLIPLRYGRRDASSVTGVRAAMIALLRRLSAVGIPGRVASKGYLRGNSPGTHGG
jgi:hypothetical protein